MSVSRNWEISSLSPENHVTKSVPPSMLTIYLDLLISGLECPHKVINHGGINIKASWSRMPFRSVEAALLEELPIYRRFASFCRPRRTQILMCLLPRMGRPEIYRIKLLIEQIVADLTNRPPNELSATEAHYFPRFLEHLTEIHQEEYHASHLKHIAGEDAEFSVVCGKLSPS